MRSGVLGKISHVEKITLKAKQPDMTLEQLIREIVRTRDSNFPECAVAKEEFCSHALEQGVRVIPMWPHVFGEQKESYVLKSRGECED